MRLRSQPLLVGLGKEFLTCSPPHNVKLCLLSTSGCGSPCGVKTEPDVLWSKSLVSIIVGTEGQVESTLTQEGEGNP